MNWDIFLKAAPPVGLLMLGLALWGTVRDRPRLAITLRHGKASRFAPQDADIPDANMLAIHIAKKGRGPVALAPVDPVRLVVVDGPPRVVPGQVADYLADAMRVGPVLPIPDTKRNIDGFYGKLAHAVGRPTNGKLNDGDGFTVLVSREVFRILGSGTLARCVEVQVVDNAGNILARKKLPRHLDCWFNDEFPFPAAQGAPAATLA
jgi:hypothetical protein